MLWRRLLLAASAAVFIHAESAYAENTLLDVTLPERVVIPTTNPIIASDAVTENDDEALDGDEDTDDAEDEEETSEDDATEDDATTEDDEDEADTSEEESADTSSGMTEDPETVLKELPIERLPVPAVRPEPPTFEERARAAGMPIEGQDDPSWPPVTEAERDMLAGFEHRDLQLQCKRNPETTRVYPHYPGWKSGCTHGFGYDMGVRYQQDTYQHLRQVLPPFQAALCAMRYSVPDGSRQTSSHRGANARKICPSDHIDMICNLNCSKSYEMLDQQIRIAKRRVLERAIADKIVLTPPQLQALTSLDYNNPIFVSGSTGLWSALKQGNQKQVIKIIMENSGSQRIAQLYSRRHVEMLAYLSGTDLTEKEVAVLKDTYQPGGKKVIKKKVTKKKPAKKKRSRRR